MEIKFIELAFLGAYSAVILSFIQLEGGIASE
jgi:hypothetical protein